MTSRLPANKRQAFLLAALSLLLAFPHAALARAPASEGRPLKRPSGIMRFGRNFIEIFRCRTLNARMKQELSAYGPQFPRSYDPSDFSFWALVNSNWPMAVEYELEQQGTAVVTIKVRGAPDFTQTLTGEGIGRRSAVRFTLPAYEDNTEKGPHAALISIKATRHGPAGDVRANFVFHGAGAGAEAVASLSREPGGVEVAGLGPLPRGLGRNAGPPARRRLNRFLKISDITFGRAPGGYAFSFKTNSRFSRWGADIMQKAYVLGSNKDRWVTNAEDRQQAIEPNDPVEGTWDGRAGRRKVPRGEYSLRVRLWVAVYGDWAVQDKSEPFLI